MDWTIFDNKYITAIAGGISGVALTIITQQILNKRGLLAYCVNHNRIGLSTDDAIFGSVRITWNGNSVDNLYLSTIELKNCSMRDYENVVVRAFSNDTMLLTERTDIADTTRILNWSPDFSQRLTVPEGQVPSASQFQLYQRQREYLIPILNRGQVVHISFLNQAISTKLPTLWLDVLHKGVKLKFRIVHPEFMGVAQPMAALAGVVLGFVFLAIIIAYIKTVWVAALAAFIYGAIAQTPGALFIRIWRSVKQWLGG
jgi:hypothetical protein